jgi:1-acyl-sn-glycerol-3-phosphate acyltransferase
MASLPSKILNWGFRGYVRRFVRKNFNAVRVTGQEQLAELPAAPIVCFINHPGWWDPMTGVLMTDLLFPGRQFAAPMDAEALKSYPILERLGFFAVERETASGAKDFLRTSRELLKNPQTILWLTPAGKFHDIRQPAPFMNGLSHLVDSAFHGIALPMAIEYTFWNERSPELLVRFGDPVDCASLPTDRDARTLVFETALATTQTSLAETGDCSRSGEFHNSGDGTSRHRRTLRSLASNDRRSSRATVPGSTSRRTVGVGQGHQGRTRMTAIVTSVFVWSSLGASAFVSVMFLVNLLFFRKATASISRNALASGSTRQPDASALRLSDSNDQGDVCVSVLIPARNEALRIGPLLDSVLASEGVSCDLCVLDDESQDGTDAIVEAYSKKHPNVRLLKGTPVPAGWSGKQFACYQLAQQAKYEELVFLDADVALTKMPFVEPSCSAVELARICSAGFLASESSPSASRC